MGLDNPLHIAFLVVILLLVFGAKRLPEIGRSLGSGMREFKQSITGEGQQPPPALGAPPQQPALESSTQPAPAQTAVAAPSDQATAQPAPEQPAPADQQRS
jgi:sec-independent protein translocase protein TatA